VVRNVLADGRARHPGGPSPHGHESSTSVQRVMQRPLPHPTALSEPFWEACRDRRLTVQRCQDCGKHVFLPQSFCPNCLSRSLSWVQASGTGSVVTYTVVWRPQTPAFEVPYVIAVVRLDEGVEMLTNLVDAEPEQVSIGARVRVAFADVAEHTTLPFFRLVENAAEPQP
jgi:uncharacterized OB-fold protein